MTARQADRADPHEVRLGGGAIMVTTDCCQTRMSLPRDHVDLVLTQRLVCRGCDRHRQLDFLRHPRCGLWAAWSDPPGDV